MIALRRLHAAIAVTAGLALAAEIYRCERAAVALLVIVVIAQAASLEALRALAQQEKRP